MNGKQKTKLRLEEEYDYIGAKVPRSLKTKLVKQADLSNRSLAAQILTDLNEACGRREGMEVGK